MTYKITLKNQLQSLRFLLVGTSLFLIALLIFYNIQGSEVIDPIIPYILIYYVIVSGPSIFCHIKYYSINKNDVMVIDELKRTININDKHLVAFADVKQITLVLSPFLYRNGIVKAFPSDGYCYAILNFYNTDDFIITSLMCYKLEDAMKTIDGVPIERKRKILATTLI